MAEEIGLIKCRLETGWVMDVAFFMAFFLITFLIPFTLLTAIELMIIMAIGLLFSIGKGARIYVLSVAFLFALVFIPRLDWEGIQFIPSFASFIKAWVHYTTWILFGYAIGAVVISIFSYWRCRRGEIL